MARITRRRAIWLLGAVAILASALLWEPAQQIVQGREDGVLRSVGWRARVLTGKAIGRIPELSWSELLTMLRVPGGFGLEGAAQGQSIAGSLRSPYVSAEDVSAGFQIFSEQCESCHGPGGIGRQGPALNRVGFGHGDSDLAMYTVLRDGIAGTAMSRTALSARERWQVVAYVRSLQLDRADERMQGGPSLDVSVSSDEVVDSGSRADRWLTYSGSLNGHRFSSLDEINVNNVEHLRVAWVRQLDTNDRINEATPLVVDGTIFTTEPPATIVALDARSGSLVWRYRRTVPDNLPLCCGRVNRGLAILGSHLFLATLDGNLVAVDANSGQLVWEVQVADPADGFTMTGAPLVVQDSVIVGVSGGEFGVRGFLDSYDANSGQRLWRFNTIPGPDEPGHETWESDAWQTGGGPTWVTGSYDPELDLLYWGVGNPSPDFAGHVRPGDNLYTDSVLALHATSGELAWHFQFTPHDVHDWDANQTPVLADLSVEGAMRRVIAWPNRNGFYYVLDRATGEFLSAAPFVEVDWASGIDEAGRPVLTEDINRGETGRLVRPGIGGTNWQNPAFDPERGIVFVPATEGAAVFTHAEDVAPKTDGFYWGSASTLADMVPYVRALDAATGTLLWEYPLPLGAVQDDESPFQFSGLLATAGGLVFGAAGGYLFALDSTSGAELWRLYLGGDTRAAPITFSIDGRQVIAVAVGRAFHVLSLPPDSSLGTAAKRSALRR